jgi:hypothetical protein
MNCEGTDWFQKANDMGSVREYGGESVILGQEGCKPQKFVSCYFCMI